MNSSKYYNILTWNLRTQGNMKKSTKNKEKSNQSQIYKHKRKTYSLN